LFPLGSAQTLVFRALEYAAQGADVHIACCSNRQVDWLSNCSVTIHVLAQTRFAKSSIGSHALDFALSDRLIDRRNIRLVLRLNRLIQRLNPDRIFAWGQSAAWLTQLSGLGLSMRDRYKREWNYFEPMIPYRFRNFERLSLIGAPKFSRAIVPHQAVGEALRQNRFRAPIEIVPNSPQPRHSIPYLKNAPRDSGRNLLRSLLGLPETARIAGAVAPLVPRSRLKDLIWATDLLTVVRDDFRLAIFGCGWQYERLKRFASFTEAENHVHFLGQPDQAWEMFQGLDFFWHSHRFEPLPINLMNAMQLGIPVISVVAPGTEELVFHQQTGFGVSFGARDEFARWTKFIIEQESRANQIIDQARQSVGQRLAIQSSKCVLDGKEM
jgi:glycosyltransferase involved in cell wall biosynthesis